MRKIALALMVVLSLSAMAFAQGADAKAKADEVLKKARAAIGDESKLKGLQSLSASGTVRQSFGERQMESEVEIEMMMPDKIKRTTNSSFATIIQALNGEQMWNDFVPNVAMGGGGGMRGMGMGGPGGGPGGGQGANSAMSQYFQLQQRREMIQVMLVWLLVTPPSSQMQYVYIGEAPGPEGSKLDVLDGKSADGIGVRLYFTQEDHKLIGLSYKARTRSRNFGARPAGGPGGPGGQAGQPAQGGQRPPQQGQAAGGQGQRPEATPEERERRMKEAMDAFEKSPEVDFRWALSEYKSVGGINLPHRLTKFEGQNANEEWEISKFKVNPKLTADKFVKKEKEKAQ
ncbi:MAG: hypothetical protein IPG76_09760 [Acidobacteria bacterium]|nr:hypothetical protein [Acidobacteriota bacterium]